MQRAPPPSGSEWLTKDLIRARIESMGWKIIRSNTEPRQGYELFELHIKRGLDVGSVWLASLPTAEAAAVIEKSTCSLQPACRRIDDKVIGVNVDVGANTSPPQVKVIAPSKKLLNRILARDF